MITKLDEILDELKKAHEKKTISVANAADDEVIEALAMAQKLDLVNAILVGNKKTIEELAAKHGLNIGSWEIVEAEGEDAICEAAVRQVSSGKANTLMKGLVNTSAILKAALNKEWGLRTGNKISHIMLMEVPTYGKLLTLTDAAMNIAPTLEDKVSIIENAKVVAHKLGNDMPRVAIISAAEKVNEKMNSSVEAATLQSMNEAGEVKDCIIAGPVALDLAISKEACEHKGYKGKVQGDADVLVMPTIEAGNVMYKTVTQFMPQVKTAGVIMGAKCPIILTSRADTAEAKLYSIALATYIS